MPKKYVTELNGELGGGRVGQLSSKHRHPGKFRGKLDECVTLTKDIICASYIGFKMTNVTRILIASRRSFAFQFSHLYSLPTVRFFFFFSFFCRLQRLCQTNA